MCWQIVLHSDICPNIQIRKPRNLCSLLECCACGSAIGCGECICAEKNCLIKEGE